MNNFRDGFVERLKKARKEAGMTQKWLSEKSGIPLSTLAAYENMNRETMPDAENLYKIAVTLGKSIDWLCGMDTEEPQQEESSKEITSQQWIKRLLDMISFPQTYKASVEDPYGEWQKIDMSTIRLDIDKEQWDNNGIAFMLLFYGEELHNFITAIQSVKALDSSLDPITYSKIRETVIEQYAKYFDPDTLPF